MSQDFLGVYATNETAPSLGDFPRPLGKRKRLWFAWDTPDGRYKVQALNAVFQPMSEPRVIAAHEFEQRFEREPDCPAVPVGYSKSPVAEEDNPPAPLPDLFAQGAETPLTAHSFFQGGVRGDGDEGDGRPRADDPDLLRNWAQTEPRFTKRLMDPSKIPFDRLVGETPQEEENASASAARPKLLSPDPADLEGAGEKNQPEEARLLRSKFVQALLLLRRGEREESTALLQDMLTNMYPPFDGAAQLFSEFGLGLRRLGLVKLALVAHRRAWDYAPEDERVLFNIARSYHDLDMLDEARDYLERALARKPDFASAKQFLAFLDAGKKAKQA